MLNAPKFNSHLKAIHNDPECSVVSFEQCLEVSDNKKIDTGNVLPKSMEHFLHLLKIMKLWHFSESKREAINRNWSNQKANPALKTKTGNK